VHTPTDLSNLSPDALVARAERLLEMAKLIARAREPEPLTSMATGTDRIDAIPTLQAAEPEPTTPEATCLYGCESLSKCAALKTTRLDAWRVLHYADPEEVKRRDNEATDVMMARVGKPHPWLVD
jgi:hypothetical protein